MQHRTGLAFWIALTCWTMTLGALLPTTATAADPGGLNCDVTIPLAIEWSDYFDQVGDSILFDDDECGLSVPVDTGDGDPSDSYVTLSMNPVPHQSYTRMFILASGLQLAPGDHVTVFELVDTRGGVDETLVELRVAFGGRSLGQLQLVVTDDVGTQVLSLGSTSWLGDIIKVELKKSSFAEMNDGFIAVDTGDPAGSEILIDSLQLWNRLPTEARFGIVDSGGRAPAGTLVFQPMELGYRFFSTKPGG